MEEEKPRKTLAQRLGLSNTVYYHNQNPNHAEATDSRKSLAGLDYRPLRRVTLQSLLMGLLISMGGMVFGYDTGQISGFLVMPNFLHRFGQYNANTDTYFFSNVRSGLIVALLSIGTLIGALIGAPIAELVGRKYSVSIWCVILAVGFIIQISATTSWIQIMMGRWVAGLGVGALSLLVPMYQAETAPRHIRGALISTYQLFITLGIFLAACFNFGTYEHQKSSAASWRIVIGIGFVWIAILGFGILFFPETPRFAYRRGRTEEAKTTMEKVYGAPSNHYAIHVELEEIEAKLRAESAKGSAIGEWFRMFSAPSMAYRIALGVALQALQQLTGANFFFYYGTAIFQATGINNSYVTQMILNGINFGTTFYGLYIIEHYGRRKSLIAGSSWMFICFLIFSSVGHFALNRANPQSTPAAGTAMIVFAALFIFGYATTWGPMIWTICGELYPSRYRSKAMALSTASNWLWNFLLAFFTPFITGDIDYRYGYVFAACNFLGGLVVYFFVLEGQGRTLEELDTMYLLKVKPWKSSSWVPPPPEELADIRRAAGTADDADVGNFTEEGYVRDDADGKSGSEGEKDAEHAEHAEHKEL